jgi:dolichol-phosphate mannosyltransferase
MEKMIPVLEQEVFPNIKNHEMHILVADDKSPDGTAEIVRNFAKQYPNLHLIEGNKEGLGAAYARAMRYSMNDLSADAIVEFDADFQHDPQDIPKLIAAMDEGADCVIGSRYVKGGSIPKEWGLHRKFLSYVAGSLFTRLVWGRMSVHDMTSGFKLTKSSFLKRVDLENLYSKYYAYKLHILHDILSMKAKVKEVPIQFYERTEGSSKITSKDLFDSLYVVVRLRLEEKKRFVKFLFVGGTGFIVQFIVTYFSIYLLGLEHMQFVATLLGAETAIISNFLLNNVWTFKDTKGIAEKGSFGRRLFKFNLTSLLSIAMQSLVTFLAVRTFGPRIDIFGHSILTSLVILFPTILFIVLPLNYFIYNKIIWKTHYLKDKHAVEA